MKMLVYHFVAFVGCSAHADDIRILLSLLPSLSSRLSMLLIILMMSEVVRFSKSPFREESVPLHDRTIAIAPEAKCLSVWWSHSLSAHRSFAENICKA
jgi:hypothetical protein